jgi:putative ABC transport system permease protein
MFIRLVRQSFQRQIRRKLLAGTSVMLGVTVATAMMIVALDIGDKINRELRSYGANLVVFAAADSLDVEVGGVSFKPMSASSFLDERHLPNIKSIFWGHNIVGFAPALSVHATIHGQDAEILGTWFAKRLGSDEDAFTTGARSIYPWWHVTGEWPRDDALESLVGEKAARRLGVRRGDRITIGDQPVIVTGILSTGGVEDDKLIAPLRLTQRLAGRPGAVQRIYVSALTTPEDDLARRDPSTMNPELFDRWYCTPYVQSIARQLQEAIPGSKAEQIRQVAQNEGTVLSRIKGLMLLVSAAALLASILGVSAAMTTAILERRREIGLMKGVGAANGVVAALLFTEVGVIAVVSGTAGFGFGALLAQQIGRTIFNAKVGLEPLLYPIVLAVAVGVTFAGSTPSIRRALRLDPAIVLRGES